MSSGTIAPCPRSHSGEHLYFTDITLMNKLVKGMLAVSARLPPYDGSCMVIHACAMVGYVLPIRLHVSLKRTREVHLRFINKNVIHYMLYTTI